jgi:peroxiredoxin
MKFRIFALLLSALTLSMSLSGAGELSNRRAPGFSLPDTQQRQYDLYDYRGKVVLIEIMQTSCDKCQTLTKMIEARLKPKYGDKLVVLGVVVPPDSVDKVKKYIDVFKVTYPILYDSGQMVGSYIKASPQRPSVYFPHVFLIDQNGMIRNDWQFMSADGYKDVLSGDALVAEIDKLLVPAEAPKTQKTPAAKTPVKK